MKRFIERIEYLFIIITKYMYRSASFTLENISIMKTFSSSNSVLGRPVSVVTHLYADSAFVILTENGRFGSIVRPVIPMIRCANSLDQIRLPFSRFFKFHRLCRNESVPFPARNLTGRSKRRSCCGVTMSLGESLSCNKTSYQAD